MATRKTAIIIGLTGQDGAYLAQHLLRENYRVIGAVRRASTLNLPRLSALGIVDDIEVRMIDLDETAAVMRLLDEIAPHEIYNLGGQSSVAGSFQQPLYTARTCGLATLLLLEVLRQSGAQTRLFQASSSEIFGRAQTPMQNETTLSHPKSPYGVAKLFAHWSVINYREAYDLYAVSGILFSHESPLRGLEFVTRKATAQLANIAVGRGDVLRLGNLESQRDWGYAGDYVRAMWLSLQQPKADDYVIATGQAHSVRAFVERAGAVMGFDIVWEGEGVDEIGRDAKTGKKLIEIDPHFYRPSEPDALIGDAQKAQKALGWTPKINFESLVQMMAEADLKRAQNGDVWF